MNRLWGRSALVLALVGGVWATPASAGSLPAPPYTCRTFADDIKSRPGNPQIIEPIFGSNTCTGGGITRQSVTVMLQRYNSRGLLLPGRWETVTKRSASKVGPGTTKVSTRWNCGDPHRNNAGRVRLRVAASGWVMDVDGDFGAASVMSANEIVRDCNV